MRDLLSQLVSISSETKDLGGVYEVQKILRTKLHSSGGIVNWVEPEHAGYAPALVACWPGKAEFNQNGVCLVSHGDTVYPPELRREYSLDEENGLIHGSGVADNKGGLVIACAAIEKLHKDGVFPKAKRPLYFFSSSCEELGSPAFQKYIQDLSTRLDFVLGLEPALPNGNLIKKRRGNRYYLLTINGNSVHTGRDLKEAANPISGVVLFWNLVEKLRDRHPKVSISLNGIKGYPFKFNMSCEKIEINIDTRFESAPDIRAFHDEFMKELKALSFSSPDSSHRGNFFIEIIDDCPAFDTGIPPSEFLQLAVKYSQVEKKEVSFGDGLGASDCCYFYREGLKIIDGLGPRGGKIHSSEEFIEAKSLDDRAEALAQYLAWLLCN